jgi:branched-chain amino acid transport system ATP-binding protein
MTALKLSQVGVSFAGLNALSGIDVQVGAGEIVAFVGPNGAGKTTLFNVITGYTSPTSGTIELDGRRIGGRRPSDIAALGVRRTFQNGGVFPEMTVFENVLTGLYAQTQSGVFGLAFNTRAAMRAEAHAERRAWDLIDEMGLREIAGRKARDLSGGQQRMLEITRTIATSPPVILLDEPAVGLSPTARLKLAEVIRDLARKRNAAVLLIEHAVELVMSVSDRIVVLNGGRKIAEGTPEEIRINPVVLEAYLG